MKAIPKKCRDAAELVVKSLLADAVRRVGKGRPVAVNDPDYAEAFGILRGVLAATYGNATAFQALRLADGNGPATHQDLNQWMRDICRTIEGGPASWQR